MDRSPRASAALLRVVVERLCNHLQAKGTTLNEKIEYLVGQGLPEELRQPLHTVRVIGNNAVHPGKIDVADNRDTVSRLCELVYFIVEEMITRKQRMRDLSDTLAGEIQQAATDEDSMKHEPT